MYITGIIFVLIGLNIALFGTIQSAPDLAGGIFSLSIGITLITIKWIFEFEKNRALRSGKNLELTKIQDSERNTIITLTLIPKLIITGFGIICLALLIPHIPQIIKDLRELYVGQGGK